MCIFEEVFDLCLNFSDWIDLVVTMVKEAKKLTHAGGIKHVRYYLLLFFIVGPGILVGPQILVVRSGGSNILFG